MSRASLVLNRQGLLIDGAPALIQAGVLHYMRVPAPRLWTPLLERIRMAGLNAVVIPFPWAYHSPAPGFHDFTGPRDVRELLAASERLGLWLIPHIGPWLGMGLDGGGVPAWLHRDPQAQPILAAALAAPPQHFLRHVEAWWAQLLPLLARQANLLCLLMHPGLTADQQVLQGYARPLLDLVRRFTPETPVVAPSALLPELAGAPGGPILPWVSRGQRDPAAAAAPWPSPTAEGSFTMLDVALPLHYTGMQPAEIARVGPVGHPRSLMAAAWGAGPVIVALDPIHMGVNWGWWAAPGEPTLAGFGAPLAELAAPTSVYHAAHAMAQTIETVGPLLVAPPLTAAADDPQQGGARLGLRAAPPHVLAWGRQSAHGALAALIQREERETLVQVSLGNGTPDAAGEATGWVDVEDIPLGPGEVRLLPLDWALMDGRLISTTLEPVLHTLVAGRELIVLRNDVGGELVLPPDFRHRHSRGPVYLERAGEGMAVHIDPARIASALFDGPGDHVLQILALTPAWAERVWPLDDLWRAFPTRPASWTPAEEAPARGVVIGPEIVIPEADGGFRFLTCGDTAGRSGGFGYRWGPWRGSDPHTWLAPLSWPAAPAVALPPLDWASRPGAPEALPDYDDRAWRAFPASAVITAEALGVDAGFIWYRAHFDAPAEAVTLACRHACDLFLNGAHIAALSAPPDAGPVTAKTLPLPTRHLRAHNVLALLVEHQGREVYWDTATAPHGLIAFTLSGDVEHTWRVRAGLTGEVQRQGVSGFADWTLLDEEAVLQPALVGRAGAVGGAPQRVQRRARACGAVTWHRATFRLALPPDVEAPIFLVLDQAPTKCYLYLNGMLIGRFGYPRQPERRFWLPEGLLRREGVNELLIAQWTRGASPGLGLARLEAGPPALWRRHAPA